MNGASDIMLKGSVATPVEAHNIFYISIRDCHGTAVPLVLSRKTKKRDDIIL